MSSSNHQHTSEEIKRINQIPDQPLKLHFSKNGFEKFEIYWYKTLGDGNCFFHSILMGMRISYRQNPAIRKSYVRDFRNELAFSLARPYGGKKDENGEDIILYDQLSRGYLREYAVNVQGYDLNSLMSLLLTDSSVGQEIIEAASIHTETNVFILSTQTQDVYIHGDYDMHSDNWTNVVILYDGCHYSLVGIKVKDSIVSHFVNDHPFIEFIRSRIMKHIKF